MTYCIPEDDSDMLVSPRENGLDKARQFRELAKRWEALGDKVYIARGMVAASVYYKAAVRCDDRADNLVEQWA